MNENLENYFGFNVFNEKVMKDVLSNEIYKKLKETIEKGKELDLEVADNVAREMKKWALSKGATHFTHWFQPMTGITAEKHDSFLNFDSEGRVITEFSGKELIKGEPDASSFPSGGLRSTFEARGYTAWDPTSYAFIKDKTLCIPTAFCSFGGEALDKKTPLLRSMDAINKEALRIVKIFNKDVSRIIPMVGPEQEYFLIDKEVYKKRKDLLLTNRTLFGAPCPKGQQLDDHYFGIIKPRIQAFMNDLNEALWMLGVPAKTEHNEVAPAQYELAPIYESSNIATDHNQITMEIMKKIAEKHDLVCLLHEKPFALVNGSGKHNNWSLKTDTGINLFSPGKTQLDHLRFSLFVTAVVAAVDKYQDLIRISVATQGNDNRLGANEAPPAIVSIYLGEDLTNALLSLDINTFNNEKKNTLSFGVTSMPTLTKDSSDRNRTSPFAFTGNKFELRMLGSSNSTACPNIMLNSAVASVLKTYADELEKDSSDDAIIKLIKREMNAHKRIIFNGNGYDDEWVKEAEKRGLLNLKTTPDALSYLTNKKNVDMLTSLKVFTETELEARYNIQLENYVECMLIEARTMVEMVNKDYLPVISSYSSMIATNITSKRTVNSKITCEYEEALLETLSLSLKESTELSNKLSEYIDIACKMELKEKANYIKDNFIETMAKLREKIDKVETICPESIWPYPTYEKILFSVI